MTRVGRLGSSLASVLLYAVSGRQLELVDQKSYWETRSASAVDDYQATETDRYYREVDRVILGYLERYAGRADRPLLEVGAYLGYRLAKFARALPDRHFVGVDLGFTNLKRGRDRGFCASNAAVVNADACLLPFRAGTVDLAYTIVALTHISHRKIRRAIDELLAVTSRHLLLVEIDCRPMRWHKKLEAVRLRYGYMHRYDELVDARLARLVDRVPLHDDQGHPRYTLFLFQRVAA